LALAQLPETAVQCRTVNLVCGFNDPLLKCL